MKKLAAFALVMLTACTGPDIKGAPDATAYTKASFQTLNHDGDLTLNKVKIEGALTGRGVLAAGKCRFGSIDWMGQVRLAMCRVDDNSQFVGPLEITRSSLKDTVKVNTSSLSINESSIGGSLLITSDDQGKTDLNRVKIKDTLEGMGSLKIHECAVGDIKWTGPAQVSRLKVRESAVFNGTPHISQTKFKGSVTIAADAIELSQVSIDGDLLIVATGSGARQKLILSGKSDIKGNVTFASGNGVVEMQGGSRVRGQVRGTK